MKTATVVVLAGALAAAGGAPAADGAAVYKAKCAACHAATGTGNASMAKMFKVDPAALDLTTPAARKATDADLTAVITVGKDKKMPAYGGKLTAEEIAAVVAQIRNLQGGGAGKAAAEAPGAATYAKSCKSCHGADGTGNEKIAKMYKLEPAALSLVGADTAAKTDEALVKITTDGSADKKMPAYGKKLSAAEIQAVVSYIRSLKK